MEQEQQLSSDKKRNILFVNSVSAVTTEQRWKPEYNKYNNSMIISKSKSTHYEELFILITYIIAL